MKNVHRFEFTTLFFGDLFIYIASLWLSLCVVLMALPSQLQFFTYFVMCIPLIFGWIFLYKLGGLYDRHLRFNKKKIFGKVWITQIINISIAFVYFDLIKNQVIREEVISHTILLVFLAISTSLIVFWRLRIFSILNTQKPLHIICLGNNVDVQKFHSSLKMLESSGIILHIFTDIKLCLNFISTIYANSSTSSTSSTYANRAKDDSCSVPKVDIFVSSVAYGYFPNEIFTKKSSDVSAVTYVDMSIQVSDNLIQSMNIESNSVSNIAYDLLNKGVEYMDIADFYENVFEMISLQIIDKSWFIRNVSVSKRFVYKFLKRTMDICISLPLAIISIVFYPIVYIAIKLEDKGPIFIFQNRIGEHGSFVRIIKFRSMTVNDEGKWVTKNDNRITRVGKIIRKTRIDELPQLINILQGDLSLVGPRPELPTLVDLYKKEIPFYNARHMVKPGLSGWAQVHHDLPPQSIEETKVKLSYDLYYIKNCGIMLDLQIAFATIKTLLSRTGI